MLFGVKAGCLGCRACFRLLGLGDIFQVTWGTGHYADCLG